MNDDFIEIKSYDNIVTMSDDSIVLENGYNSITVSDDVMILDNDNSNNTIEISDSGILICGDVTINDKKY